MVASLVLITTLCGVPTGASAAPDPGGWRELRWGMTVADVEAALTKMNGGKPVTLVPIPSGERRGKLFEIVDFADHDGPMKLGKRTAIFRTGGFAKIAFSFDPKHGEHADQEALAALSSKYGKPIRVTKQLTSQGLVGDVEESQRLAGSTIITLRTTPSLGPVSLEYAVRAAAEKDPVLKEISSAP